ncbi:oligoribonuclease-like isoform X2 [Solanum dulcamara]|uniref:oligoribonuclease-like isoform X2 n=1 Tax=Solanum dulcamara TaxID=45834 RepID=UPI002486AF8B|nr:oligoribonuclease-like isoform X2 [Solanum dulcamara]
MIKGFHKMNQLSNGFSCLNLDAADSQDDTETLVESETVNGRGKAKEKDDNSGEYELPLVWIDLEMTGLDIEVERILEIACIITDGKLTKSIEGPDLVIHQTKECLDNMGEWCQSHHAASGLTQKVLKSTITEEEAEMQVVEFVKRNIRTYTPLLAGNSVYTDLLFLKKYMPNLASLFSHVLVDVSSVKALCFRWYPRGRLLKSKTSTELWMTLRRA